MRTNPSPFLSTAERTPSRDLYGGEKAPGESRPVELQFARARKWEKPSDRLTAREWEVAELAPLRNDDIALALGITRATVKTHLMNVARKTGLETRAAIAVLADRRARKAA